jgi:hypothetical protein
MTMTRSIIALAAVPLAAGCMSTMGVVDDPGHHSGHEGYALGLAYDADGERVAGGELEAFGGTHGVAGFLNLDYKVLREDRGESGLSSHRSATAGFGLRLSPIGLFTRPGRFGVLRFFDTYGDAGVAGGIAGSSSGVSERTEAFVGAGLDLRAGFGHVPWFPGITTRYRHVTGNLSYRVADEVFVGLTWMRSYRTSLRFRD